MTDRRRGTFLAPALLGVLGACGGDGGARAASPEDVIARERAAAYAAEDEFNKALEALLPLVERDDPAFVDVIHAVSARLEVAAKAMDQEREVDRARQLLRRAEEMAPDDPRVPWAWYRIARAESDLEQAITHLRRVHELVPDDVPTRLLLGGLIWDVGQDGDDPAGAAREAEAFYRSVLDIGVDFAGSWYLSANYRLATLMRENDRMEEALRYLDEDTRLRARGITAPTQIDIDRGTLGSIAHPDPRATYPVAAAADGWPRPSWGNAVAIEGLGEVARFAAITTRPATVPDTQKAIGLSSQGYTFELDPPPQELLLTRADGLALARRDGGGSWTVEDVVSGAVNAAVAFDLGVEGAPGGDGDLDLVFARGGALALAENRDGRFRERDEPLFEVDGTIRDVEAVDYDHEGDLDLLVVGDFGTRLLRNDGAHLAGGAFTDATEEAGLDPARAAVWCATEDFDVDNDVDLLLGDAGSVLLATNERAGRFADASATLPAGLAGEAEPLVADRNADGWPDFARDATTWLQLPSGAWEAGDAPDDGLVADPVLHAPPGEAVVDLRRDGRPELLGLADGTLTAADGDAASAMLLALHGKKDNHRGVGAVVELLVGPVYRRLYWRGEPQAIFTHGRATIDVVRVTWPNGVIQNAVDVPATGAYLIRQREGLVGSCPFLYAWNGEEYVFISDVIGITPLGLPMGPGMLVPPDHDEYVLVRGDQLAPRDGFFELQFTEELREVTYLDRIRLDVVDHPEGTEIFPNERFTFPPFPEPHTHTLRDPLKPARAVGSDGADWTSALAAADGDHAEPFEPYVGQLLGLTDPWFLELEFDAERVRDAEKLRLAMTGWLYWTDASVNMAAARHPDVEFVPPILQVPDGRGGWRDAGPPVGFPAGKTKTMVIDVSDVIDRDDPRVRVFTTLRLYWEAIRLAVDADDAPLEMTSIEPASANLWMRGFSKAVPYRGHEELDWFDWNELEAEPRWNQHPGLYTKLGECLPLLTAVDDMYVIMGAGDALTVRFPAEGLPPPKPGWTRDYLVFLDGWAKDRDPNSHGALYVTPLPFHGMSGYPYGPDEAFPDDKEHRAWRREWNTRPDHRWIAPLAPGR